MWDAVVPVGAGAVIGYVTNWLAIKMLFWPREEKVLFGLKVPMTPGLFVRRRQEFSSNIAYLVESRFANADDLYAMVQKAEDQGLLGQFLDSMGPFFRVAFTTYMKRVSEEDFKKDCRKMTVTVRRAHLIANTVRQKIDEMEIMEIEAMVIGVVQRELRVITWLGAVLGSGIGAIQWLL